VAGTASHLKNAKFEHLGQSLGESLPTLRAQLATMQIDTDGLSARIDDLVEHLEKPRATTMLRVWRPKRRRATSLSALPQQQCAFVAVRRSQSI
jgi:hypothetical protein